MADNRSFSFEPLLFCYPFQSIDHFFVLALLVGMNCCSGYPNNPRKLSYSHKITVGWRLWTRTESIPVDKSSLQIAAEFKYVAGSGLILVFPTTL